MGTAAMMPWALATDPTAPAEENVLATMPATAAMLGSTAFISPLSMMLDIWAASGPRGQQDRVLSCPLKSPGVCRSFQWKNAWPSVDKENTCMRDCWVVGDAFVATTPSSTGNLEHATGTVPATLLAPMTRRAPAVGPRRSASTWQFQILSTWAAWPLPLESLAMEDMA